MAEKTKVDYGNVQITKLPPGKAYGADDLTNWAARRVGGQYGTGIDKAKSVLLVCPKCEATRNLLRQVYTKARDMDVKCACGGKMRVKLFRAEGIQREGDQTIEFTGKKGRRRKSRS